MTTRKYEEPAFLSHQESEKLLAAADPSIVAQTLIAMGLHDSDWRWVQDHALKFLSHSHTDVVSAAVVSLAHTARVNNSIDKPKVIGALLALSAKPEYIGKVQDAIDDIETFVN